MDDDGELVARARAGERAAYEALVRAHHSAACRMAWVSGAGADAEDVVQESFVRAFGALGSFRPGAAFRPWLLRIVVNQTRNLHRSRLRLAGVLGRVAALRESWEEIASAAEPPAAMLLAERHRVLWAALSGLADKDRQVLGCRYLLDMSEAETAAVLGWPRGSVKSRSTRALARLRERIAPVVGEVRDHA
ncbi:RNA polymerase sigma factor [Actinokineospora sp. NBRC 105648]|uniref:RNA polymerase sigma factor n=1 Tax=Actinokineospora sp. NBRC 105648 TaxID=3032206 RepID=UPI00249F9CBA|nr:RNA polymerase sigma factor [Actinokineospora sp. NBRC 105648]GLZ36404.1 RNA polymerase sigma factor [Actinokineospora sp. NBRC 105648]